MRTVLAALAFVHALPAHAAEPIDKACILKAAAALPAIPDLAITKTATRPLPEGVQGHAGFDYVYVDVDFAAAGVTDRATFLCASAGGKLGVMKVAQ
jgi:hypothetical protein